MVLQSCRGTFDSGGEFDPMRHEREDGLDTVAWIERQPWFDGNLFTSGPSYLGYTQWALAPDAGPAETKVPPPAKRRMRTIILPLANMIGRMARRGQWELTGGRFTLGIGLSHPQFGVAIVRYHAEQRLDSRIDENLLHQFPVAPVHGRANVVEP